MPARAKNSDAARDGKVMYCFSFEALYLIALCVTIHNAMTQINATHMTASASTEKSTEKRYMMSIKDARISVGAANSE